jgi:hypothetical protein
MVDGVGCLENHCQRQTLQEKVTVRPPLVSLNQLCPSREKMQALLRAMGAARSFSSIQGVFDGAVVS